MACGSRDARRAVDLATQPYALLAIVLYHFLYIRQSHPQLAHSHPLHWLHETLPLVLNRSVRPVSQHANSQLTTCPTYMAVKDRQAISTEVYSLAASGDPIGERVKEALDVIESALDAYTCVLVWPGSRS